MQVNAVQCSAVQCSTVQCSAVQCSAVQCSAVRCSVVQCSAMSLLTASSQRLLASSMVTSTAVTTWREHCTLYIVPRPGHFFTVTFVDVHHSQMSTFVIDVCLLWCIGVVTVSTTRIDRKYWLWYNVSIPFPKSGLAENTGNVELWTVPLLQHYSVFSAQPDTINFQQSIFSN